MAKKPKRRGRTAASGGRRSIGETQDPRLTATRVLEDAPGDNPAAKKGDWLVVVSPVADSDGNVFWYYPPQPILFNLIEAKRHRDRGSRLRRAIMGNLKADQRGRLMPRKSDAVMDCLSELVGAVLHAFTAIECFANHTSNSCPMRPLLRSSVARDR